ncbi:hypothetical protein BRAS3809_3090017 [Bradyrhizobium sp. STM 3809]|nr:hypothetical protein BRAS3809_3090017 [Bradyrhizobium sp. STM 3809]
MTMPVDMTARHARSAGLARAIRDGISLHLDTNFSDTWPKTRSLKESEACDAACSANEAQGQAEDAEARARRWVPSGQTGPEARAARSAGEARGR